MPHFSRPSAGPKAPEEAPPDPVAGLGGKGAGSLGAAGKYGGLGLQFALSILLFLYAGQWLDRRLDSSPLFVYLGVFLGAGAAFYSMYRSLMADQRRDEARQRAAKEGK